MHPTAAIFRRTAGAARNAARMQKGLFDGRSIMSGNKVSEKMEGRTRRQWKPNVTTKSLFSEALDRKVRLKVTTGALRTIDKVGGLDTYLFRVSDDRLGKKGLELREEVKQAHSQKKNRQVAKLTKALAEVATLRSNMNVKY